MNNTTHYENANFLRELTVSKSCPECGLNAWAKPSAVLLCGECRCELTAAE